MLSREGGDLRWESPGWPSFRLLFEPVRAASASDEKIGWAAASFSSPGRLVRAGSPGAGRLRGPDSPGPPRSEPSPGSQDCRQLTCGPLRVPGPSENAMCPAPGWIFSGYETSDTCTRRRRPSHQASEPAAQTHARRWPAIHPAQRLADRPGVLPRGRVSRLARRPPASHFDGGGEARLAHELSRLLSCPSAFPEDVNGAVRAPLLDGQRGLVPKTRALSHYSGEPSGKRSITRT